ncbi:hypothetical protein D3C81_1512460 [compost metagenome]
MNGVRAARLAGQIGTAATGYQEHLVFFPHHFIDGQDDRRSRHVDDHIHLIHIEPTTSHTGPYIWLVLVISRHDFDLQAMFFRLEVGHRLLCRPHRARTGKPRIGT